MFKNIENVQLDNLAMGASSVTLDIRYFNPNHSTGKLKNAEGDAFIDDKLLGHFIVDSTITIPANSEFLIPVKLAIEMKDLLKYSLNAFLKDEVTIKIIGKAKAGKSGFYKTFDLNYTGKQNLSALFEKTGI